MTKEEKKGQAPKTTDFSETNPINSLIGTTFPSLDSHVKIRFNDYIFPCMTIDEKKKSRSSRRIAMGYTKAAAIIGAPLAYIPRFIPGFLNCRWFIRWPVRIGMFILPFALVFNFSNSYKNAIKIQEEIFDKYQKMDPLVLKEKIVQNNPEARKMMLYLDAKNANSEFPTDLRKKAVPPKPKNN